MGIVAIGAVAGVGVTCWPGPQPTPAPVTAPGVPTVLAPADGALRVGATEVPQMAGVCGAQDGSDVCRYTNVANLPTVLAATNLPVRSGQSSVFQLSIFNVNQPSAAASARISGGMFVTSGLAPGLYQATVKGDAGGTWQFLARK